MHQHYIRGGSQETPAPGDRCVEVSTEGGKRFFFRADPRRALGHRLGWLIEVLVMTNRILVIDDDLTALDIVDLLFEDRGFDVVRRPDGLTALECIEETTPDIILIDLMMPRMSGQECVRQIRRKGIEVPIVAFTAIDDPLIHDEARAAGCDVVVTKPCKSKVLVEKIETLLQR